MKQIFRTASLLFIFTALVTPKVFAQHPVLFETFGVCDDLCPLPVDFYSDVQSVVNAKKSEILHLDYHCLFSDPLVDFSEAGSSITTRLTAGGAGNVFFGCVDRADLATATAPWTKAETEQNNGSWGSDMEAAIDAEHSMTPPDQIQLVTATLDQTTQNYTFQAKVAITATSTISDSVIVRYAVVEDNVALSSAFINAGTFCKGAPTTYNDLVRWITTGDSVVFLPGTAAGTIDTVSFTRAHFIGAAGAVGSALGNPANMRFIVFLEQSGGGDFSVIDAEQLISNLSTLPAPPATLALKESSISGQTLYPGMVAEISYSSTSLPLGVTAYFSTDDGTDWILIADSLQNPVAWTVPDTLTTQGKIKLVGQGDPSVVSIEQGTFTIARPSSISFTRPAANIVIPDTTDTIAWTKYGVGRVTLQYSIANSAGTFAVFKPIIVNTFDTSFVWTPPDTTAIIELQLVPDSGEAPAYSIIDTLEKRNIVNSVAENAAISGLAITNIYPNPASNGQEIVVAYSDASGKPVTLQLLDLLGRQMPSFYTVDQQDIRVNTSALEAGVYVVRLSDGVNTVSKRVEVIQ